MKKGVDGVLLLLFILTNNYIIMKRIFYVLCGVLLLCLCRGNALAKPLREKVNLDDGWRFVLNHDDPAHAGIQCDDSDWQRVTLPHDWSISLPFDNTLSGAGGQLPGGVGWYRNTFSVPASDKGRRVSVLFDGIYNRSDVYLNGHHLGFRPYGFCYIEYDLTPYLNVGGENVLAVRVNNPSDPASIARWYTGSGIYRHAWLVKTAPTCIDTYGTYVVAEPQLGEGGADLRVTTTLRNASARRCVMRVEHEVMDADGKVVGKLPRSADSAVQPGETPQVSVAWHMPKARLWDVDTPYLYTLRTKVYANGRLTDSYQTVFGVRSCTFTSDRGFLLNGRRLKLKGFCLHQDDASLGSAMPLRSMERKLQILKAYGVNAVRCSHNQPAPEFLDLCDRMGFVVIDEAFDKWKSGYYAEYFDEWWQRDLTNMVVRDRNHPCVVLWSIGNELQEAWDQGDTGVRRAAMLQDYVHALEPSRQVCLAAQNRHQEKFSGVTDVVGYNYLEARMLSDHKKFPERCFVVTEELPYFSGAEGNIRVYETINPWNVIAENDFIAGGFIWSGVDYIGEASYPSRGWPTGLFDICMVEKPRAAYHRAMWNSQPMVSLAVRDNAFDIDPGRDLWQWPAIASVWNFPRRYEGLMIDVQTTTNCERVVLFQNGVEVGCRRTADFPNNTISWCLPYKKGTLVAKGVNGLDTVAVHSLRTTGQPERLRATADRTTLWADGQDLCYVQVELQDRDGLLVQHEERTIKASLSGEGELVGFISSDLRRTTPFTSTEARTHFGRAMAIVRTTRKSGDLTLSFQAEGMDSPCTVRMKTTTPPAGYLSHIHSFNF